MQRRGWCPAPRSLAPRWDDLIHPLIIGGRTGIGREKFDIRIGFCTAAEAEAAEMIFQAEQEAANLALAAHNHQITLNAEAAAAQAVLDEAGRKGKRDARYASRKARR